MAVLPAPTLALLPQFTDYIMLKDNSMLVIIFRIIIMATLAVKTINPTLYLPNHQDHLNHHGFTIIVWLIIIIFTLLFPILRVTKSFT